MTTFISQLIALWDFSNPISQTRFGEILTSGNDDPVAVQNEVARADGLQQDFEGAHPARDAAGKYTDPSFFLAC